MEWVETTGKSVEEAKERALDQLGVAGDDAEFEIVEEPRTGLFGRVRGEARVRARVKPTPVRPKVDRRRGRRTGRSGQSETPAPESEPDQSPIHADEGGNDAKPRPANRRRGSRSRPRGGSPRPAPAAGSADSPDFDEPAVVAEKAIDPMDLNEQTSDVGAVRDAAVRFVTGLTDAFGFDATVDATVDGTEIEIRVGGENLGVLIGPGGRTLLSIQDLARVAAQRRLHDHETRLRVDVAGYREKRRAALERFAATVAQQVRSTGVARALDPMPSADRKVIHDALAVIDGVVSRSEGEDPDRRVVVAPAS